MAEYTTPITTTFEVNRDGTVSTSTNNAIGRTVGISKPTPKGSIKVLSNGQRFRRATPYQHFNGQVQPGEAQLTTGFSKRTDSYGAPRWAKSSPGGYAMGIWFSSVVPGSFGPGGFTSFDGPPSYPTGMTNEVKTSVMLNLANQKAGMGENLATMKQTIDLIKRPSSSFALLTKNLRYVGSSKRFKPFLKKTARDIRRAGLSPVAEDYLKYVYGFLPLMQDIYGLMELLKEQGSKSLLLHAKSSTSSVEIGKWDYGTTGSLATRIICNDHKVETTIRCSVWAEIDPAYAGLRALNQLGLLNPGSLAWELVPYSFVVDWFVPIGSVLQALTAPVGLKFINGSISSRVKSRGTYTNYTSELEELSWVEVTGAQPATGSLLYDGYNRSPLSSFPRPGLWYSSDPLRGDRPLKALALGILNLRSFR